MTQTTAIVNRVLPILLLLLLGNQMRHRRLISSSTIDDLRSIVVNVALPSVLFLTFIQIELKATYLYVFILSFLLDFFLFGVGNWLGKQF